MTSSDESDVGELTGINSVHFALKPYQFEPTVRSETTESESETDSKSSDSETETTSETCASELRENAAGDVLLWCSCARCSTMSSRKECRSCRDINLIDAKVEEAGLECITQHEGFAVNCLNRYVLETSFYEYIQDNGPLEESALVHETYRYLAYRRFSRWIWQRLGKRNRRVLPSCIVAAIRDAFPSQEYCGFKYPK